MECAGLWWKPLHQDVESLHALKKGLPEFTEEKSEVSLGSPQELPLIPEKSLGVKWLDIGKVRLRITTTVLLCSLSLFLQP